MSAERTNDPIALMWEDDDGFLNVVVNVDTAAPKTDDERSTATVAPDAILEVGVMPRPS